MFWLCSSLVFTMIYLFILILPWTRLRDRLTLPTRKSFYIYAGTLAMLDLVQSIGAGFLNYTQNPVGLCIVDFTAAVYLTLFTPLVYHTFLSEFFGVSQPSIMFSYKAQVDDAMDEDTVSLPHQQSFSSLKTDSDYIYQVHTPSFHVPLYDSQTLKSSSSKHKVSLHSLPSPQDSKSGSGHIYEHPTALYRSTSGIKSFARRLSADKTPSDFKNYPLTKSDNFIDSKKSTPDLRFPNSAWKSSSVSQFKYGGPSSVSNLLYPPTTASNFLYKPRTNDSNTNLFSLTRKSSLKHERKKSEGNVPTQSFEISPLENTLQSILDSGNHDTEVEDSALVRVPLIKDPNAARVSQSGADKKESSPLKRHAAGKASEIDAQYALPDLTDASNATQQLLSKPAVLATEDTLKKRKRDSKKKESGGLSEYLLSLATSSTYRSQKDSKTHPSPSSHDTQTESL